MRRLFARPSKKTRRRNRRSSGGFTLVEVVVALAILALSGSVIFGAIGNALWSVREANSTARAGLLAQSLLARIGADLPLRTGETAGEFPQGFSWRVNLQPYGDANDRAQWPIGAYAVTVEILWRDGAGTHSLVVKTLRLGRREQG
ncbi:MAG TPA: prepilin-type N-terminal cleavage/methylation domain-containing protein [Xanthobacteraceae bacterium]|nr:prepilin-type N-terminal cleavage/methylation domain-containing protein [Xanthobacteraceae bacterium]